MRSLIPAIWLVVCFFTAIPCRAYRLESHEPHEIQIIPDGLPALQLRLEMIERARHSIELETFIYSDDFAGRLITSALVRKAKQGVRVRVLLDALPLWLEMDRYYAAEFAKAGIEFRYYNTSRLLNPTYRRRDHRKHLIIDADDPSAEMVTGGRNVADEYFDLSDYFDFIDRDVWIKGPIVRGVRDTFDQVWVSKLSHPAAPLRGSDLTPKHAAQMHKAEEFISDSSPFSPEAVEHCRILRQNYPLFKSAAVVYVTDLPDSRSKESSVWTEVKHELDQADGPLQIETPYFVLKHDGFQALRSLKKNRIPVTVVTNSLYSTDWPLPVLGYQLQARPMLRAGADVRLYDAGVPSSEAGIERIDPVQFSDKGQRIGPRYGLHGKSMVFGARRSMIGTFNVDPASIFYNLEDALFFPEQPEIARLLQHQVGVLLAASHARFETTGSQIRQTASPYDKLDFTTHLELPMWLQHLGAFLSKSYL